MKPLIIGIAGGTGSGKTTLVDRLLEQFGDDISVLPHDNYYAAHHDLSLEQRQTLNYDHPASFDTDRMIQDLQDLRAGKTIHCPVYDYAIHDRTEETRELKPNKVILVEGILIFENKTLRDLMDIKLFVDTDADVRILRRIVRDVKERGRSLDSVVEQYLATVKPMHEQFVEPSKRYADLIVPEGGKNSVALMMIIQRIAYHIEHGDVVAEQQRGISYDRTAHAPEGPAAFCGRCPRHFGQRNPRRTLGCGRRRLALRGSHELHRDGDTNLPPLRQGGL